MISQGYQCAATLAQQLAVYFKGLNLGCPFSEWLACYRYQHTLYLHALDSRTYDCH